MIESDVAVVVDTKFEAVVIVVEVVMLVGEMVTRDVKVVDPGGGIGRVRVAVNDNFDEEIGVEDGRHVPVMHRESDVVPAPPPSLDALVIDIQFSVSLVVNLLS